MEVKPVGDWILVNKTENDHVRHDDGSVMIYKMPDTIERTNYAEIVEAGPRCKYITEAMYGSYILAPEMSNDMKFWKKDRDTGSEFFFIRERFLLNDKANRAYIIQG